MNFFENKKRTIRKNKRIADKNINITKNEYN